MSFQPANLPNLQLWWHETATSIAPISACLKQPSTRLAQEDIVTYLDKIHDAYVMAHRIEMPIHIKAQLIAAICHLQTSFCAGYEGEKRQSTKHHRMAQVEWVLFQDLLKEQGIHYSVIQ